MCVCVCLKEVAIGASQGVIVPMISDVFDVFDVFDAFDVFDRFDGFDRIDVAFDAVLLYMLDCLMSTIDLVCLIGLV